MKKLLIIMAAIATISIASAQEAPVKKGDVKLGLTLGYNGYVGMAAPSYAGSYELAALEGLSLSSPVAVGFQGDWFVTKNWALRFGGGFAYTYKPGYASVPGTMDGSLDSGWDAGDVPSYRAVGNASVMQWQAYVGMNHYWQVKKVPNLYFYCGVQLGFSYAINEVKYDEESSMGRSLAQVYSAKLGFTAGADYYVLPSMYVGLEVQPVQYAYSVSGMRPQEGMKMLQADSHSVGFLASPTFKIGFKF